MRRTAKGKPKKHPWFKRKNYLHFDLALERSEAEKYVTRPENILRHRFSPLIHYFKISRKIRRDKDSEKAYRLGGKTGEKPKLIVEEKSRNIFYTSHVDGYIYSYYGFKIQKAYEKFLLEKKLTSNVIAYRPITKNGIKFCNSHLADEAFNFIRSMSECHILCFDISKFFDKLSVGVLKEKWAQVLGKKWLPSDHFKVYESLVNFCYIEEAQLVGHFKDRFETNPRQHGLDRGSGGSLKNRICECRDLRELKKILRQQGNQLIKEKEILSITGIPQGTAISGLLSNIFMADFDIAVKGYVESKKGIYRRYSDDILIAVPTTVGFSEIEDFVKQQLNESCAGSIQLNDKKTEKRIYQSKPKNGFGVFDLNLKPSKAQYLGFHFDGQNVFIRNSSISKDRGKTVQLVRKHKKRDHKINTVAIFKQRSPRKITPFDNEKAKGFVYYSKRAANAHSDSATITAQTKKNDRFIKKIIVKERNKEPTP
ncbi:MAG: hypothetical protein MCM46_12195 [Candidatus Manganitrophus sp. SB1]|nr:hypothetical protein [Candidatus Manganitrophus morganii]